MGAVLRGSVIAAILLAVSGCASDVDRSAAVEATPAEPTTSPIATSTISPIVTNVSPTAAAISLPAADPRTAGAVPACHAIDLAAAFPEPDGDKWHSPTVSTAYKQATDVILINRSQASCTVNGWVTLTMIGRDVMVYCAPSGYPGPSPCGGVVDKTSVRVPTVDHVPAGDVTAWLLRPGQTEPFTVLYDDLIVERTSVDCPMAWDAPVAAEFRISGDDRPIRLEPFPIGPCRGRIGLTAIGLRG